MARKISSLGIDSAKVVFHVVGMDDTGTVGSCTCTLRIMGTDRQEAANVV